MTRRGWHQAPLVLGVLLLATAAVSACGEEPGPTTTDAAFVAQMLPHHHLGMLLVEEATLRSDDVRLRRLVFEMGAYHQSEIEQLETWQREWGVVQASEFPGDIASADLALLPTLDGLSHDSTWLRLMIEHHEGAMTIARSVSDASDDPIRELASSVERVQGAELTAMRALFDEFCSEDPVAAGCP